MLILATDMARHAEIMENFKERLGVGFDSKSKDHIDTVIALDALFYILCKTSTH